MPAAFTRVSALLVKGPIIGSFAVPATVATAGPVTVPNASLINAIYNRDLTGAIRTDTTDTAKSIIAAMPGAVVGTSFQFIVRNVSAGAFALTIAGGTGVTIVGTATVAQSALRTFRGVVTGIGAAPAISLYSLGSGAF